MSDAPITVVPENMVIDFVDGKTLRKLTPEEYVRQNLERSLVGEYKYDKKDIEVEFPIKMGTRRKRVDLAVFPTGKAHEQQSISVIVETKAEKVPPTDAKEGVEQLKSYMAACMNCKYGLWTNGLERFCYRKEETVFEYKFTDILDIPAKGMTLEEWERPTIRQLKPATGDNLLFTFRRCHNYIHGNQGLSKQEAFSELLKLIFCKIEDERTGKISFHVTSSELGSMNGDIKVRDRIGRLFGLVREKYPTIFKANESIELHPNVLAYIVSQLQGYYLLETDVDVKGKAYEEIVGPNLRGDRGEFFTPRNICRMAVDMLDPEPQDVILDPACGTGGFLIAAIGHVMRKIDRSEQDRWRDPENPTDAERQELYRKRQDYLNKRVFGIDINPGLVKASKMNMVLNNDGSGGLFPANSLVVPVRWAPELQARVGLGSVDILFTNPPFGSKIPVNDRDTLQQFEIARQWDRVGEGQWVMREGSLQRSLPPEQVFVERCVQFLKPGTGCLAIVLPDSILSNPALEYLRYWILNNTQVLASIDMPTEAFQPWTGTQTSVLVLRRKGAQEMRAEELSGRQQDYDVFMAIPEHVGHDRRGNTIYKRDPEGNEIVQEQEEIIKEVDDRGRVSARKLRTNLKIVNDQLPTVAGLYLQWARERGYARFDGGAFNQR
ncbi:MAG TPA: N-6 DNA methylase [Anaerolineae bacterium]|nr:N-6 DNA methylase [Anaerolineae bacterium]